MHTLGFRMCTPRAYAHAQFGRPNVHISGVRMRTLRALQLVFFGRPKVHTSGVQTFTARACERAHFGRPNVHNSGVQMCTIRASECAQLERPNLHSRASKGARFACANVHEPAAQRRRVTIAQHYCRWSPQQAKHLFPYIAVIVRAPGEVAQNIGFAGTSTETVTEPPRFADVLTETVTETVTETIVIAGISPRARENVF